MDLMESVGKLLAHADEPGTVSEALKDLFMGLKGSAGMHASGMCDCKIVNGKYTYVCLGSRVTEVLKRLGQTNDPFYGDMPMLERVQVQQMAHTAVKLSQM